MLGAVQRVLVKVDPTYYDRTHGEVTLYLLQEGTEFQRLPKHGELVHNLEGSNIPTGATVYFVHYAIKNRFKYKDEWYVPVEPKDILAYEHEGEMIGYSSIVSKRVHSKEWIKDQDAIIKMPFVKEWEDMCFEVTHNPTKLNIEKGDRVWILENRDYFIEHIPDYRFLEPEFVVYNETKDEIQDHWMMGKTTRSEDNNYELVNGIYVPKKITHHNYEVEVLRGNALLEDGKKVLTKFSKANHIPYFKDCIFFKQDRVMVCLN